MYLLIEHLDEYATHSPNTACKAKICGNFILKSNKNKVYKEQH